MIGIKKTIDEMAARARRQAMEDESDRRMHAAIRASGLDMGELEASRESDIKAGFQRLMRRAR